MVARSVSLHLKPNRVEEFTRIVEYEVIPMMRGLKGFQDKIVSVAPGGLGAIGLSFWDRKEDADAYGRGTHRGVMKALAKVMKWLSIVALLVGAFMTSSVPDFRIGLEMIVCVTALLVVAQAFRSGQYIWGIGFAAIAVMFNPAVPVAPPFKAFLLLDLGCIAAFIVSLAKLRWHPIRAVPSITGRTPTGSESL